MAVPASLVFPPCPAQGDSSAGERVNGRARRRTGNKKRDYRSRPVRRRRRPGPPRRRPRVFSAAGSSRNADKACLPSAWTAPAPRSPGGNRRSRTRRSAWPGEYPAGRRAQARGPTPVREPGSGGWAGPGRADARQPSRRRGTGRRAARTRFHPRDAPRWIRNLPGHQPGSGTRDLLLSRNDSVGSGWHSHRLNLGSTRAPACSNPRRAGWPGRRV